jgi:Tfp pilus assembly protein PilF
MPIRRALEIRRDAAEHAPGNAALKFRSERAIGRWGCLLFCLDPTHEKSDLANESIAVLRRLCTVDPNNAYFEQDLILALNNYGIFLIDQGQYQESATLLRGSVDLAEKLAHQPKAPHWAKDRLGESGIDLAECYIKSRDFEEAKQINSRVLVPLIEEVARQDADSPDQRFLLAEFYSVQGEISEGTADPKDACRWFKQALAVTEQNLRVRNFPPESAVYGELLASYGNSLAETGEKDEGCAYIRRGLEVLYRARDSKAVLLSGDLARQISKAENNLQRLTQDSLAEK